MSHSCIQNCCRITLQVDIIKDERLVSKMEGKTNFSRHWNSLMASPDWPWPHILRQIYATGPWSGFQKLKLILMVINSRSPTLVLRQTMWHMTAVVSARILYRFRDTAGRTLREITKLYNIAQPPFGDRDEVTSSKFRTDVWYVDTGKLELGLYNNIGVTGQHKQVEKFPTIRFRYGTQNVHDVLLLLGRLPKVDLIILEVGKMSVRTSVRPSVRPQKVSSISMKFGI